MKQYLTPDQTAKLIELGFEKPKTHFVVTLTDNPTVRINSWTERDFSIGELIEMLPKNEYPHRRLEFDGIHWFVDWDAEEHFMQTMRVELIDALYDMCVMLKEEGVI